LKTDGLFECSLGTHLDSYFFTVNGVNFIISTKKQN